MGCCNDSNFSTAPDAELDPAQRVAYSFGMVLGVDDFKQEHAWIAGRTERALRETIGYGVLAGLDMTVQARGSEVEVVVQPGLAIGPDGKSIAVTAPQCASLNAWLNRPGTLDGVDVEGEQVVYVVLRYAELASTPVPIPGEPCRDEASQLENSRIGDSFALELSWQRPGAEEDDAVRQWAAWLRKIEVQDSPTSGVTITEFQTAVEALSLASASPPPLWQSKPLVIPREQYTAYVSAAFEVWVRKQRLLRLAKFGPVQSQDSTAQADGAVSLGRIHFRLGEGGALALNGELSERVRVDTLERTQVVHLRMLQEWLASNAENDAPREAYFVLNHADERMPNVQDLFGTFFGELEGDSPARGRIARVDSLGARTSRVVPAKLFDGPASEENELGDYYGPNMAAPIPPADGGTGQQTIPADGQLLVGSNQVFTLANLIAKVTDSEPASLSVEHDEATHDIVLDTVQPLHPGSSPVFVGATLTGVTSNLLKTSADGEIVAAKLFDGPASEENELGDYYGPNMDAPIPPADGGTGQQTVPADGQLLVGNNQVFTLANLVAKVTDSEPASLSVEHDEATHDIVLDTVQPLHPGSSPVFVGATLTGVTSNLLKTSADGEIVAAELYDGPASEEGNEVGDYYGPNMVAPIPPADGGTGQQTVPTDGQLLVGSNQAFTLANLIAKVTDSEPASLSVEHDEATHDIVLDTVQPLHPGSSPVFVGATLTGITSSVLAVNADGQVGAAVAWDGDSTHLGSTHYYAPGQLAPVRIEDGGTGQRALPGPIQVLVGAPSDAPEFGSFVLATLTAGDNITLGLARDEVGDPGNEDGDPLPGTEDPPAVGRPVVGRPVPDRIVEPAVVRPGRGNRRAVARPTTAGTEREPAATSPEPERAAVLRSRRARAVEPNPWKLVINAKASSIEVPVTPTRGGTGLSTSPSRGQILVGGDEGDYVLSRLTGANNERNTRVGTSENGLEVDTAQDIHTEATPLFQGLFLKEPKPQAVTHRLGWDQDSKAVVIDKRSDQDAGALHYRVRVVSKKDETPINDDDQVLIVAGDVDLSFTLPKPLTDDGRVLTFRSVNTERTIGIRLQGAKTLTLNPDQSVTVICVPELKQWVEIGGGNHAN